MTAILAAQDYADGRSRLYAALPLSEGEIRILILHPSTCFSEDIIADLVVQKLPQKCTSEVVKTTAGWVSSDPTHPGYWRSADGEHFATQAGNATEQSFLYTRQNKYEALSYVWGNPDPPWIITVNGIPFQIGTNLYRALQHIRARHIERSLWVDAICIDQQNYTEKTIQVAMMSFIYSASWRTIIWLGEDSNVSDGRLALDFWAWLGSRGNLYDSMKFPLEWFLSQARGVSGLPDDPDSPFRLTASKTLTFSRSVDMEAMLGHVHGNELAIPDALSNAESLDIDISHLIEFFRRPWFSRRWILQEFSLAPNKIVQLGTSCISWALRHTVAINKLVLRPNSRPGTSTSLLASGLRILGMISDSGPDAAEDLWTDLRIFDLNGCYDARDRLAAFQWRIKQAMIYECPFHIDYSITAEDNYLAFATAMVDYIASMQGPPGQKRSRGSWTEIRWHLLTGLVYSSASRQRSGDVDALPSWVPDWRIPPDPLSNHRITRATSPDESPDAAAVQPLLQSKRITFVAWLPKDDSPMVVNRSLKLHGRELATFPVLTLCHSMQDFDTVLLVLEAEKHQSGYDGLPGYKSIALRSVPGPEISYRFACVDPTFYFETDEGLEIESEIRQSTGGLDVRALWTHLYKHGRLGYLETERREYRTSGVEVRKLACYIPEGRSLTLNIV